MQEGFVLVIHTAKGSQLHESVPLVLYPTKEQISEYVEAYKNSVKKELEADKVAALLIKSLSQGVDLEPAYVKIEKRYYIEKEGEQHEKHGNS